MPCFADQDGWLSGSYGTMMLWFVFALMTAAAIFAVLWPLGLAADARRAAISRSIATSSTKSSATGRPG